MSGGNVGTGGFSSGPANGGYSVTPSDGSDNVTQNKCRAIAVLVSGDVKVLTGEDETVTVYVTAGAPLPFRNLKRIYSTGTTATGVVVLY